VPQQVRLLASTAADQVNASLAVRLAQRDVVRSVITKQVHDGLRNGEERRGLEGGGRHGRGWQTWRLQSAIGDEHAMGTYRILRESILLMISRISQSRCL
jgi:hypothetical protein